MNGSACHVGMRIVTSGQTCGAQGFCAWLPEVDNGAVAFIVRAA